ncbi:MAG TPA: hypothetical protein VHY20_12830, partial [Pirellulales bacterium]|nr:hypothetical protein [Pirellulales bacterium]
MYRPLAVSALLILGSIPPGSRADERIADPPTVIADRGKLLVDEDLSQPIEGQKIASLSKLSSGWRFKPGKWEFVDGVLQGTQIEEEHHWGVASRAFAFKDAIIQVDCQLHGAGRLTLRVNDANEHICRVVLSKLGFSAQRDDHDHEGPDQAVPFGEVKMRIAPDDWKTILLEIKGDEMAASIDGQSITGSNPLIGQPKASIGLVAGGNSARFRNL